MFKQSSHQRNIYRKKTKGPKKGQTSKLEITISDSISKANAKALINNFLFKNYEKAYANHAFKVIFKGEKDNSNIFILIYENKLKASQMRGRFLSFLHALTLPNDIKFTSKVGRKYHSILFFPTTY